MSIVDRARRLELERSVALKLLAADLGDDAAFQERGIREIPERFRRPGWRCGRSTAQDSSSAP